MVVKVTSETLAVLLDRRPWPGKMWPGWQVLQSARGTEHMPVHEQKIDTRAIAMLTRPAGIALMVARPGLPSQPAQGPLFSFRKVVPLVTRCMPELVKQAMLGTDHPSLEFRGLG